MPRVTVLLPVYNGSEYLSVAIKSILCQTFSDFELLIINDGSTDNTPEIITTFSDKRIRVVHNQSNLGLIACLNKGISLAKGEFIARQDSDDVALPDRLKIQVEILSSQPKVVLVGTWLSLIDTENTEIDIWRYPTDNIGIKWAMLFNSPAGHPSVMFRTKIIREIGGYSKDHLYAEDYGLWARFAQHGEFVNIPQVLQQYRVHPNSITSQKAKAQDKKRAEISEQQIKSIAGNKLTDNVIRLLSSPHDCHNASDVTTLISGYNTLLEEFSHHNPMKRQQADLLKNDCITRLSSIVQILSFPERVFCLIRKWNFFPKNFWLTGKFLSFLLKEEYKNNLKKLFGKQIYSVKR